MAIINMQRILARRLPILTWILTYNSHKFVSDVIAGITVGLVVMPQALAYAAIAGLEPEYGLYASFIEGFVYVVLGTSKSVTIGPETLICLLTYQQVKNGNPDYAVLLCFITGIVQLAIVICRLDTLMDFFSVPVTAGYISASALIIGTSQLKNLFGLKISSSGFWENIAKVVENVEDTNYSDLILGLICIVALLCLRALFNLKLNRDSEKPSACQNTWNHVFTLVANSRNIIVVTICSLVAFSLENFGNGSPFSLTGTVKQGLPSFKIPPFGTIDPETQSTIPFSEMLSGYGTSIILIPVVSALTNVAIARGLASNGKIDTSQEIFCLSIIHILGSFFSSMPVTAVFSRSAVNKSSGVETQAGGIITAIMVLLALQFLTPLLFYIPKTSLAAMIMSAIIFVIEYKVVKPLWRSDKKDMFILAATFFPCLIFDVEYGILIGVAVNLVFLLYPSARPKVTVETRKSESGVYYLILTPRGNLCYPSIDYVNTKIEKAVAQSNNLPVVINCQYVLHTDYTAAKGISFVIQDFLEKNQPIYFVNTEELVASVFQKILSENFIYFNSLEEFEATLEGKYLVSKEENNLDGKQ